MRQVRQPFVIVVPSEQLSNIPVEGQNKRRTENGCFEPQHPLGLRLFAHGQNFHTGLHSLMATENKFTVLKKLPDVFGMPQLSRVRELGDFDERAPAEQRSIREHRDQVARCWDEVNLYYEAFQKRHPETAA